VNKATITASSNSPICVNQNLTLNATAGASNYAWSGPNGFTATTQNPTIPIATGTNAGTYSVTITDINGCVGSASTIVSINPLPNPTATKPVVCKGEPIDLNSNGLSPLQWTFPDATTTTTANPSILNTTAANAGTYSLKNTTTGCAASYDVLVLDGQACLKNYAEVVSSGLTDSNSTFSNNSANEDDDAVAQLCYATCVQPAFTLAQVQATCVQGTPSTTSIAISGITNGTKIGYSEGVTYSGDDFATAITVAGATYTINDILNPSVSTTYTIRIYNMNACCFTEKQIVVNPSPCATATNSSPVCEGGNIILSATGGGTYAWSGPNGFTATTQDATISGITAAKTGIYTVTVTMGSYTATATTTVTMPTQPTITASSNTPVPIGQTIQLAALSTPTYSSYTWSGPNAFTSNAQNPTLLSAAAAAGTYTVTVIDENNCTATTTTTLAAPAPAPCTVTGTISANPTYCEGDTIRFSSSGGTFYSWSGPNGWTSISQYPVLIDISSIHTGTYAVTVTGADGGCTDVKSIAITVYNKPYIGADQSICESDTLKMGAFTSEKVQTSKVKGTWTTSLPVGLTLTTIPASPASDSLVQFIFVNTTTSDQVATVYFGLTGGCRDTARITVKPAPTLVANNTTICAGGSINLTTLVTNYAAYLNPVWKKDSLNGTIIGTPTAVTPATTTTYYVTADSTNGCKAKTSVQITVNTVANAGTINAAPLAPICKNGSGLVPVDLFGQLTGEATGGAWSQIGTPAVGTALNVSTGFLNPNGLAAGTYTFRYTVTGLSPCPNDTEDVQLTIQQCCPVPTICLPVTIVRQ
jgi:hypothetical protein